MKTLHLLIVGGAACFMGGATFSNPSFASSASSAAVAAKENHQPDSAQPCLIGTRKCIKAGNAIAKPCLIGTSNGCPTDGYKVSH